MSRTVSQETPSPGGVSGGSQLRELQGAAFERAGVSALRVGAGEADLPGEAALPALNAGHVRGEVDLHASDQRAAQQPQVDPLADNVPRAAARTAKGLWR